MPVKSSQLAMPELVAPTKKHWIKLECDIRDSAVDAVNGMIRVPRGLTEEQRLARIHEMLHAKHSPEDFRKVQAEVIALAAAKGEVIRPDVALKMSMMLEENRIDWIGWHRYKKDIRPCREVLDWSLMTVPTEPYRALGGVLQLAWTVWGSKGLSKIADAPPPRIPDAAAVEFFDACWSVVEEYNDAILPAMIRACLRMYEQPTNEMRNQVAAELSTFFPPIEKEEDPDLPPLKPEEKKKQEEAEKEEDAKEQAREEEESGAGGEPRNEGHWEIHDHTASIKRPSMRIARKERPVFMGHKFTFMHRYMLDKAVFSQRMLTEGGIMIDGSGSMNWTDADMEAVLARMPAVHIGRYNGVHKYTTTDRIYGRVCILAKNGLFAKHIGKQESDATKGNEVDLEALKLLATWPKPRLWLSDGLVCGGMSDRGIPYDPHRGDWLSSHGALAEECNKIMRAHDILRVPNTEVMHRLLRRERVTLYGSCVTENWSPSAMFRGDWRPWREWPVTFCL